MKKFLNLAIGLIAAFMVLTPAKASVAGTAQDVTVSTATIKYVPDATITTGYPARWDVDLVSQNGLCAHIDLVHDHDATDPYLPIAGTYTSGNAQINLQNTKVILANGSQLSVSQATLTLTNTQPYGGFYYDATLTANGTNYHFTYTPQRVVKSRIVLDLSYDEVLLDLLDATGATSPTLVMGETDDRMIHVVLNGSINNLNGTYSQESDWVQHLTTVIEWDSEGATHYNHPYSVNAVVDDEKVHAVLDCWNGVEYDITFHLQEVVEAIELEAYCSARYEKDAQIWAMSVNAIDENLYTNFFIKDNVKPYLVELPQAGTYSTGRGNLTFNYAHFNRTELEVDSIVITLAETTPVGALNADMMMYLTDGTIYHLIAEPTCEGISGTDSLDIPYWVTRVFQSDPGAQMQMVQMFATLENYTYAIVFKNRTLATLPGTYGDGDWQELLTGVSYVGYDSKTTYEWPCSVSAVVDETTAHVVMHMWDGVEYTLNFHYAEAQPQAQAILFNGSEAIELAEYTKPEQAVNCASHMDSLVVMLSGFDSVDEVAFSFYDHKFWGSQDRTMTPRGNNVYAVTFPQDFFKGNSTDLRYEIRVIVNPYSHSSAKMFTYYIYNDGTAIQLVEKKAAPVKTLRDGRLVIEVNGMEYTADGVQLK